jgi:hypothetical protein
MTPRQTPAPVATGMQWGVHTPPQAAEPPLSEREIGLHLFLNKFWWLNCPTQIIGLTSLL